MSNVNFTFMKRFPATHSFLMEDFLPSFLFYSCGVTNKSLSYTQSPQKN